MKFRIYKEYGSLNSPTVLAAVESGLRNKGHQIVFNDEDISVIWSALWTGRMLGNNKIYKNQRSRNKPVLIIEVGNLVRNKTWRISLNHINRLGIFANDQDLNLNRPSTLGVDIKPIKLQRKPDILIATQHGHSLQWENMPRMEIWVEDMIKNIRQYSDRNIIVRSHPRFLLKSNTSKYRVEIPKKIINSYDDFDIDYNYHCVINHNSGPSVQAVIEGIPVCCDQTSLAYDVSFPIEQIESPTVPDRKDWFLKLCHTEWTIEEIHQGLPFERLKKYFD